MQKFYLRLFSKNEGKVTAALLIILIIAAFFMAGGYFKIKYSPTDDQTYSLTPDSDSTAQGRSNLQLGTLKFSAKSITPSPQPNQPTTTPTTRPTSTTPTTPITFITQPPEPTEPPLCQKYTNLLPNINSCYCNEVMICILHEPELICGATPTPPRQPQWWFTYPAACVMDQCYLNAEGGAWSSQQCKQRLDAGLCAQVQCVAKPVIYLYPEHEMLVDVKLEIPGIVTVSDPLYPNGGWKNVTAFPNSRGAIKYEGQEYPYLYYETAVTKPTIPSQGFVVKTEILEPKLREILTQIGLIEHEQQDFIDYWLPRLQAENKPYMFITVLPSHEKETVDKVVMSTEPDTRIEVIFEFEPLDEFKVVTPLKLPSTPPKRKGFTMVEWGGAIN